MLNRGKYWPQAGSNTISGLSQGNGGQPGNIRGERAFLETQRRQMLRGFSGYGDYVAMNYPLPYPQDQGATVSDVIANIPLSGYVASQFPLPIPQNVLSGLGIDLSTWTLTDWLLLAGAGVAAWWGWENRKKFGL